MNLPNHYNIKIPWNISNYNHLTRWIELPKINTIQMNLSAWIYLKMEFPSLFRAISYFSFFFSFFFLFSLFLSEYFRRPDHVGEVLVGFTWLNRWNHMLNPKILSFWHLVLKLFHHDTFYLDLVKDGCWLSFINWF